MTQDREKEIIRLQDIIASAITALDEGRTGDVRRILTKGRADPIKAVSLVLAKGGVA